MSSKSFISRAHSPFDGAAAERQRHMGLLTEDGDPNQNAIFAMAQIYAGQYFDDLCDLCRDLTLLQESLQQYIEDSESAEPKQRFLLLCLQYDAFYRPIPDPVWWLSGNSVLADLFSQGFVTCLRQMVERM